MRLLRITICSVIAFAVLSHGAVEPWARAVVECSAGALLFWWSLNFLFAKRDRSIVLPSVLFPLLTLALLTLAQFVFGLTASRFSTRSDLMLLLSMAIFIFLAAQAFRSVAHWRSFAWFLMIFAFLVAGLGILQHLTFNGKLYWFRELRYGGIPFGPFVNRNHFAGFVELVLPMSLVPLLTGRVRRERLIIVGILAAIPLTALILASSRGGIISLAGELALLLVVLALRRTGRRHLLTGIAVLLLSLMTVTLLGANQVLSRFSGLQGLEVTAGKRASMRSGTWRIFLDHPVIGTGLGTLQQVYPPYETLYDGKIVNHTHNDYLEALAETGLVGGICCAWLLAILFLCAFRSLQSADTSFTGTLRLTGFTACWGLLLHSTVDFNLHIPSNLMLFLLMAFLTTAEIQESAPHRAESLRRHRVERNA